MSSRRDHLPARRDSRQVLLIAQLRLLLLRAELGVRIGLDSILRAAYLLEEIEGKE